jgi:zinc transport system substrate-binding protein
MKTILTMLLFSALTAPAAGCGASPRERGEKEKLEVAAAFYPLAFAAELTGAGRVDVRNLTPPGAEPHDLEVSPNDVRRIRSADYVFLLGDDFQPQLEDAAGHSRRVVSLLDTPSLERLPNGDPHVWLDPLRYALIVRRIGEVLDAPRRAASLAERLRELDVEFRKGLARCARREIVTSHEAFAYLAQRNGLRQLAITGISPEAEPTPQDLQRVVRQVRETGATTIFFETLVSPRIAETVARETGARTAVLNPIEGLTPSEARRGADYFSLMRANLRSLRRALGCR